MTDVASAPADTAATIPTNPPAKLMERIVACAGNLARPFAIYATSGAASVATIKIACSVSGEKLDLSAAAIYIGAVFTGVAALYGAKAWENAKVANAQANTAPTP